jgi:hypothetical protein
MNFRKDLSRGRCPGAARSPDVDSCHPKFVRQEVK